MERRGQGHIEMILSFILFIGVVFFVLMFFSPSKSLDLVGSSKGFVFGQVEEQIESDVTRYGVQVVKQAPVVGIRLEHVPSGAESKAMTEQGVVLSSSLAGDLVSVTLLPQVTFITIEVSDAFPAGEPRGIGEEGSVVVSSSITERVLSEKKLLVLNQTYHGDYETLKQELQIPPGLNFRFLVLFSGGDRVEGRREVPVGLDVFVEEQRKEIIRLTGEREFASLVVSLW